jgi:hypothetical protein
MSTPKNAVDLSHYCILARQACGVKFHGIGKLTPKPFSFAAASSRTATARS